VLECVVNVSEGRELARVRAIAAAIGPALLDVHADADHNRSVFTLASADAAVVIDATRALADAVASSVSVVAHDGVHPYMGALDVVPFVSLDDDGRGRAVASARDFGAWWAEAHGVPVFLYDEADPSGRDLPRTRREAFATRTPDFGPATSHPTMGATAVGARPPLVAINLWLATPDVAVARRVARSVRERDGGLAGVRALGFAMRSTGQTQVSMNLVALEHTGVEDACNAVRELARREQTEVAAVELVGLAPRREAERWSPAFRAWSGLDDGLAVEDRVGLGPRRLPGEPETNAN
jgi:glutamate formiminotransferase